MMVNWVARLLSTSFAPFVINVCHKDVCTRALCTFVCDLAKSVILIDVFSQLLLIAFPRGHPVLLLCGVENVSITFLNKGMVHSPNQTYQLAMKTQTSLGGECQKSHSH